MADRRIRAVTSLRKWAIRLDPMRLPPVAGVGKESIASRVDSIVLAANTTVQSAESSGGRGDGLWSLDINSVLRAPLPAGVLPTTWSPRRRTKRPPPSSFPPPYF